MNTIPIRKKKQLKGYKTGHSSNFTYKLVGTKNVQYNFQNKSNNYGLENGIHRDHKKYKLLYHCM